MRRERLALPAVLCAAAALRVAVLLTAASSPQRFWSPDDRDYLAIVANLHAAYVKSSGAVFDLGLRRPPGYPLLVRAAFALFGHHYVAAAAVNVVLSVATVAATYWLARMFVPGSFALLAASAVAVDPASIVFANQMLTETPFALLITVGLGLTVRAMRRTNVPIAAAGGLVLGLAVLVRPVGQYLPLFLVPAILLTASRRRQTTWIAAAAVAIGFALPVGAWVVRNDVKTGVATVSTIDGYDMLQYRAVGALIEDGMPRALAQHEVLVRRAPYLHPGDNAAQISRAELEVGVAILAEHPVGAFKDWARGEARLLTGPAKAETSTLLTGRQSVRGAPLHTLVVVDGAITLVIVLAGLTGLLGVILGRIRPPDLWILVVTAAYLVIIAGGHESYSRFRVPVTPLFAVLGASVAAALWKRRSARRGQNGVAPAI